MALGYSISDFAKAILGQPVITYGQPEFNSERGRIDYGGVQVVDTKTSTRLSSLGTPVIFPIMFKEGLYQKYDRNGEVIKDHYMADFHLPASCIAQFKRKKIKKKTRVVAAQSSVKELYGHDDWQIVITGVFFDDNARDREQTWQEQKNKLIEWESLADSIIIVGELFQDLNIFRIDIDEINFAQQLGRDRVMAFQITGESDDPRDLFDL